LILPLVLGAFAFVFIVLFVVPIKRDAKLTDPKYTALPDSRALPCAKDAWQRPEPARHGLCRADFALAQGKGRTTHFLPGKP
jgi:hypothetical protein